MRLISQQWPWPLLGVPKGEVWYARWGPRERSGGAQTQCPLLHAALQESLATSFLNVSQDEGGREKRLRVWKRSAGIRELPGQLASREGPYPLPKPYN